MFHLAKLFACVLLVTMVAADAPSASYLPPSGTGGGGSGYGGGNGGGNGGYGGGDGGGQPQPFSFSYEVKDAESGNDYAHRADSADGTNVKGEYNVLLPDGRKQKVSYTADDQGYNADVQYEGQASYGGGRGGNGYPSGPSGGGYSGGGSTGFGGGTGGGSNGYPSGPARPGNGYLPPGK